MGRRRLLTLLVTTILVAAACGGPSEDEAIAAITSAFTDHRLTNVANTTLDADDATCVAMAVVDERGTGISDEYGMLEGDVDIGTMTFSLRDANAFSDAIIGCLDLRQSILDKFDHMAPDHERFQNCISTNVEWDLLRRTVSLELQGVDDESAAAGTSLSDAAETEADGCLRTAVGTTNPIVLAYVSFLLEGEGGFTETEANCIALGAFEDLGEKRMKRFVDEPDFNLRDAEALAFADTLTTCLDFRQALLDQLAAEDLSDPMIDCVDDRVSYELFADLMLAVIDGTDSEVAIADAAIDRSVDVAIDTCAELLDDTTSA